MTDLSNLVQENTGVTGQVDCYDLLFCRQVNILNCLKTGLGYKRPHRYTCVILSLTVEGLTSTL